MASSETSAFIQNRCDLFSEVALVLQTAHVDALAGGRACALALCECLNWAARTANACTSRQEHLYRQITLKSYEVLLSTSEVVCFGFNPKLSTMSYWPVVFPVICFQARELQTLHNLRKLFVQDLTTRVKKVRIYSFEPQS